MVPVNRKRKSLDQEKEVEEKKPVLTFKIPALIELKYLKYCINLQ